MHRRSPNNDRTRSLHPNESARPEPTPRHHTPEHARHPPSAEMTQRQAQQISGIVWNLGQTDPRWVEGWVQQVPYFQPQLQKHLMETLKETIRARRGDPVLSSYVWMLDLMMRIRALNVLLHYHLLDLYCNLYTSLKHGHFSDSLAHLTVIRKYWIDKLHPQLYHAIRVKIYRQYREDIDTVPEGAVQEILVYYRDHLKMSGEDVMKHLPQVYQAQRHGPNPTRTQQTASFGSSSHGPAHARVVSGGFSSSDASFCHPNNQDCPQGQGPKAQHDTSPIVHLDRHQQFLADYEKRVQEMTPEEIMAKKRERDWSEETTMSLTQKNVFIGRKRVHYEHDDVAVCLPPKVEHPDVVEARNMRMKMGLLSPYECKECGVRFATREKQLEHTEWHFDVKMEAHKRTEKRRLKQKVYRQEKSIEEDEWVLGSSGRLSIKGIILKSQEHHPRCNLCGQALETCFRDNKWLVPEAFPALINSKKAAFHERCFEVAKGAQIRVSDRV